MREFKLEVLTPDGVAFDDMALSLLIRTDDGDVEILAGHIDYMASVGTGRARILTAGGERLASASGGFVTVEGGKVRLVATTFEFAEDIDLERAKRAKEKAEELLRRAEGEKAEEIAKAKLKRAISRIGVASTR